MNSLLASVRPVPWSIFCCSGTWGWADCEEQKCTLLSQFWCLLILWWGLHGPWHHHSGSAWMQEEGTWLDRKPDTKVQGPDILIILMGTNVLPQSFPKAASPMTYFPRMRTPVKAFITPLITTVCSKVIRHRNPCKTSYILAVAAAWEPGI